MPHNCNVYESILLHAIVGHTYLMKCCALFIVLKVFLCSMAATTGALYEDCSVILWSNILSTVEFKKSVLI